MFLKDIQAKGIFQTRIELERAFQLDAEASEVVKKARSEVASYTQLAASYKGGPDVKALAEAEAGRQAWQGILDGALADLRETNAQLKEIADVYAGEWILLREPRGEELIGFGPDGKPKADANTLAGLFPECLVDWSLKRSETEKASKEELLAVLKQSGSLYAYVLTEWGERIPLARRSGRASIAPLGR